MTDQQPPREPAYAAPAPESPSPEAPSLGKTDPPPPLAGPTPGPLPGPLPGPTPGPQPVLSIISMISGILGVLIGFIGWGLLFSIGAVVLGHLGQRREREAKGFWLTGLITGYVGILVNLVVIVIWVVLLIALATTGNWNWYDYQDLNDFR